MANTTSSVTPKYKAGDVIIGRYTGITIQIIFVSKEYYVVETNGEERCFKIPETDSNECYSLAIFVQVGDTIRHQAGFTSKVVAVTSVAILTEYWDNYLARTCFHAIDQKQIGNEYRIILKGN